MNKRVTRFLVIGIGLIFSISSKAQQFKVVTAEDGSALPYATLVNYTHPNLVSANANGIADFNVQSGDSIAVSYVGFKTTSFIFNSNVPKNICLIKESSYLPPITVLKCKKMKEMKFGNKDAVNYKIMKNGAIARSDLGWWVKILKDSLNPKWAVRLNPQRSNAVLKNFSFWLKKDWFGPLSAIKTPLIVTFHEVTDSVLPGNEIIETPLFYYPQKEGKQTLYLDSLHINIPPNGIYVSFQIVMNDDYAWPLKVTFEDLRKEVITCYGGNLIGAFSKDFELAGFNLLKNKWILFDKKLENGDLHSSIKCEAILKYCDD